MENHLIIARRVHRMTSRILNHWSRESEYVRLYVHSCMRVTGILKSVQFCRDVYNLLLFYGVIFKAQLDRQKCYSEEIFKTIFSQQLSIQIWRSCRVKVFRLNTVAYTKANVHSYSPGIRPRGYIQNEDRNLH